MRAGTRQLEPRAWWVMTEAVFALMALTAITVMVLGGMAYLLARAVMVLGS